MHQSIHVHNKVPGEGTNLGSMGSLEQSLVCYFMKRNRKNTKQTEPNKNPLANQHLQTKE